MTLTPVPVSTPSPAPRHPGRIGRALGAAALVVLPLALVACGDDSTGGASAETSVGSAPEDKVADAATVTSGLAAIIVKSKTMVADVANGPLPDERFEEVHEIWEEVEGAIKAKDQDLYLKFEDALEKLKGAAADGDSAKAGQATSAIESLVPRWTP